MFRGPDRQRTPHSCQSVSAEIGFSKSVAAGCKRMVTAYQLVMAVWMLPLAAMRGLLGIAKCSSGLFGLRRKQRTSETASGYDINQGRRG